MKHALITGGSRRLGLYTTQKLLDSGWKVTILTRSASSELSQLACPQLSIIEANYEDIPAIESACSNLSEKGLDVIFHNASIFIPDTQASNDITSSFSKMFYIHMQLPVIINTLLAATLARSDNGNIIHMSDIYAENPNEQYALYCATKAGLESLSKSFAKKFAPDIRVNSIAPGALKFLPEHSAENKQQILNGSLLPYEAGFEPAFQTIEYILNNKFITGSTIKVDGGRSICR